MSICSDLSAMSISYRGNEVNLERQLDETIRGLQDHLNKLQSVFREIAMSSEQYTGDGEDGEMLDLKLSCRQVDVMKEHIVKMNNLFQDLMDMSDQLVYEPVSNDEKKYLKEWKKLSKTKFDDMNKKFVEERKEYKKEMKERRKLEKKEAKENDDE